MDLQGIGALVAAAVAAIGIPTALLVGRWQMHAAVRAAEETGRAGTAQAEATYRAALDAVRAETSAAHAQWRRSVQREAYASFLLAADEVDRTSLSLLNGAKAGATEENLKELFNELNSAQTDLHSAHLIVSLEGPERIEETANTLEECIFQMVLLREDFARAKTAWNRIECMMESNSPHSSAALNLIEALMVHRQCLGVDDLENETLPSEYEAEVEVGEAFSALPEQILQDDEELSLWEWHARGSPSDLGEEHDFASRSMRVTRRNFVHAARAELNNL